MNKTVHIETDADVEVLGLGLFQAGIHDFDADDDQIHVWEAVNGRSWPENGLVVGVVPEPEELPVDDSNDEDSGEDSEKIDPEADPAELFPR